MVKGERRLLSFQTIVDIVRIYAGLVYRAIDGEKQKDQMVSKIQNGGRPKCLIKDWRAYELATDLEWELKQLCEKYEDIDDEEGK